MTVEAVSSCLIAVWLLSMFLPETQGSQTAVEDFGDTTENQSSKNVKKYFRGTTDYTNHRPCPNEKSAAFV